MDNRELAVINSIDRMIDYYDMNATGLGDDFSLTVDGNLHPMAMTVMAHIEKDFKETEKRYKELRTLLLASMEAYEIKKFENEDCMVTYVESSDRETFDKKRFRKEHPDMYDEYVDIKPTSPSVRIKVKKHD